jgi:hypothetical protein
MNGNSMIASNPLAWSEKKISYFLQPSVLKKTDRFIEEPEQLIEVIDRVIDLGETKPF